MFSSTAMSSPFGQQVTGVTLPLGATPLANASATGLVKPASPVTITGLPSGQSISITPSAQPALVSLSPRSRMSPRRTVALASQAQVTLPPLPGQSEGKTVSGIVQVQPVNGNKMSPLSLGSPLLGVDAKSRPLSADMRLSPRSLLVQQTPASSPAPVSATSFQSMLNQMSPRASQSPLVTTQMSPRAMLAQQSVASSQSPLVTTQMSPRRYAAMRQMSPRAALTPSASSILGSAVMRSPTYQDLMSKAEKTGELAKYGYIPMQTLISRDQSGNPQAEYIKAIDKMGRTIFVYLDQPGYSAVSQADLTHIDAKDGVLKSLDPSDKMTALERLGNNGAGVAFQCDSGVCVVTRNSDATTKEVTFTTVKPRTDEAIVLGDYPIPFPVFRLSEIVANPELVLRNTGIATTNIRNAAFVNANNMLRDESADIKRLNESFNKFVEVRTSLIKKLRDDIENLEKWNAQYSLNRSLAPTENVKHESVLHELQVRHAIVPEVLQASRLVAGYRKQIDSIISSVDQVTRDTLIKLGKIQGITM